MRAILSKCLSVLRLRLGVDVVLVSSILLVSALSGCATEDIVVSEVAITDRPDAAVVGWSANEPARETFSVEDEEVTIKVLFNFNYRGVYEWFKVEWIAPGGAAYQVVSRRTDFASHRDFKASMKIRGKMAARLPGLWRVRVSLQGRDGAPDRELTSRLFRIAPPTAQMIVVGLTAVDAPDAVQQRPLASYSRIDPVSSEPTGDRTGSRASARAPETIAKSATAASPTMAKAPTAVVEAKASSSQATLSSAQQPAVLAPLAIVGARAAPVLNRVSVAKQGASPMPVKAGITAVSLRSTPPDPTKAQIPRRARHYAGCPPLYYRPGPGCIEQAAEE
jgi:hypothetical protein